MDELNQAFRELNEQAAAAADAAKRWVDQLAKQNAARLERVTYALQGLDFIDSKEFRLMMVAWTDTLGCWEGYGWPRYDGLHRDSGVPMDEIKRMVRELRKYGLVGYGPLVDCDGIPCGSGYWMYDAFEEWVTFFVNNKPETEHHD